MNSDLLIDFLDSIFLTPGRSDKLDALRQRRADPLLRDVILWAYDPTKIYYLKKIPEYHGGGEGVFDHTTFGLLRDLSDRKITGEIAKIEVAKELSRLSVKSSRLLERILQRDLRMGVAEKGILEIFPAIFPCFGCQLATKFTEKAAVWPAFASQKLDGIRVLSFVDREANRVSHFSRNGKVIETLSHADEALFKLEVSDNRFWVDSEATAGASFAESVSAAKKKSNRALQSTLNIFDLLPESLETEMPFSKRYEMLLNAFPDQPEHLSLVTCQLVHNQHEAMDAYAQYREQGFEGAILKDPMSPYIGTRTKGWLKIKPSETLDLPVIGAFMGEGKYIDMLGGLIVDNNGVAVRVGSGFSDADRQEIWQAWCENQASLLGRLLEVEYHEQTQDGSLRHPRAKRWRGDKQA
ncbi:MAG: hypothetical protein EOM21_13690 [Gammaproteobacteria bacterium]|nr:hypothetical protein [Gammaproteobacteria bacterium]